jgi:hypothetical protein
MKRQSDASFKRRLKKSQDGVDATKVWFESRGHKIEKPKTRIRPSYEQRFEYMDDGDLLLIQEKDGKEVKRIIEVKTKSVDFDSVESYPYKDIVLDEVYKVNRLRKNKNRPVAYVLVNKSLTGALIIKWSTFSD